MEKIKICKKCGLEKIQRGDRWVCKSCLSKNHAEWYQLNKNKVSENTKLWIEQNKEKHFQTVRFAAIKRKYGLEANTYIALLQKQNFKCAICNKKEVITNKTKTWNLAIDHDHTNGKVRGLLCSQCNLGLGKFKDDITLLQRAVNYLDVSKNRD